MTFSIATGTLASQLPQFTDTPQSLMVTGTAFPFVQDKFGSPALKSLNALQMGELFGTHGWQALPASLTFVSSDSPSYVVTANANVTGTVGLGTKFRLSHLSSTKHFIATAYLGVTGSTTWINLYGGTDYTLTTGSITSPQYSLIKAPYGFPISPAKWTVRVTDTADRTQNSPVAGTWYNTTGSIAIPIGVWNVSYQAAIAGVSTAAQTAVNVFCTLSTASNSESDKDFTGAANNGGASATLVCIGMVTRTKLLTLASKTTYYFNIKTTSSNASIISYGSSVGTFLIDAVCGYL